LEIFCATRYDRQCLSFYYGKYIAVIKIILLGPPGSGKGTQAEALCDKFSIGHISTGEILRQAIYNNTPLGQKSKSIIDAGQLIPDEIIISLIKDTIIAPKYGNGFILDGFPRTMNQNKSLLEAGIHIDFIVYLRVPDQLIIDRLTGRRYHPGSGRVYHIKYSPPKQEGIDDITGEPLIIRADDTAEVVQKRLHIYHKDTESIIKWYQLHDKENFLEVNGSLPKAEISKKIIEFIGINSKISQ
jgi:adenylate kinase